MCLQAIVKRYEAGVKRVKETRQKIKARRHEMSIMSAKYQQLVDMISRLEAAIELKTVAHKQVPHRLIMHLLYHSINYLLTFNRPYDNFFGEILTTFLKKALTKL